MTGVIRTKHWACSGKSDNYDKVVSVLQRNQDSCFPRMMIGQIT